LTISKLVLTFAAMFFKATIRKNPATSKLGSYYRLVESYRNADGRICHQTLLNIGFMDEVETEELNRIQKLLNHKCKYIDNELFKVEYDKETPLVRKWVDELYERLVREKKIDVPDPPTKRNKNLYAGDWHTIDLNTLRHKDIREIGCEWLCFQAIKQLGLDDFLGSQVDWSGDDVRLKEENRILWISYNIIREVEATIRVLKTDLDMRPIFHKKDDSTMAHLHLALMAYCIVNSIRYQLKKEGINHQWIEIVRIMNTQKAVTTTAQNDCNQIIKIRRCLNLFLSKRKSCSTQNGTEKKLKTPVLWGFRKRDCNVG